MVYETTGIWITTIDQHRGVHEATGLRIMQITEIRTERSNYVSEAEYEVLSENERIDLDRRIEYLHALQVRLASLDRAERGTAEKAIADGSAEDLDGEISLIESAVGTRYTLRQDGVDSEIWGEDLADARRQARDWALEGDYDTSGGTVYVDVYIIQGREIVDSVRSIAIEQSEPRCVSKGMEHDWQSPIRIVGGIKENPGVYGHGGGVIITEVCMRCGCQRRTDTWAQRHDTGEQGLTEVTYEAGKYADEIEALRDAEVSATE